MRLSSNKRLAFCVALLISSTTFGSLYYLALKKALVFALAWVLILITSGIYASPSRSMYIKATLWSLLIGTVIPLAIFFLLHSN